MTHEAFQEIESHVYMTATLLAEALTTFGRAETIIAYDKSCKVIKQDPLTSPSTKSKTPAILIELSETFSDSEIDNQAQLGYLIELKNQVIDLIKAGDLIPMGFKMPRSSTDNAVVIPLDAFSLGNVNWNKSEADYDGLNFSWVRLLESEAQKIKTNKFHRAGTLIGETKKSNKTDFSALSPSRAVNEKEAAKYLGISPRALQALRINGGGPEFTKQGQAIRYKMADMDSWLETHKN